MENESIKFAEWLVKKEVGGSVYNGDIYWTFGVQTLTTKELYEIFKNQQNANKTNP